eukprot:1149410-Pelagomonas_calceolata.AAC.1
MLQATLGGSTSSASMLAHTAESTQVLYAAESTSKINFKGRPRVLTSRIDFKCSMQAHTPESPQVQNASSGMDTWNITNASCCLSCCPLRALFLLPYCLHIQAYGHTHTHQWQQAPACWHQPGAGLSCPAPIARSA